MEGFHWPYSKAGHDHHHKITRMLLEGKTVKAKDAAGWLIDFAGPMNEVLKIARLTVNKGDHGLPLREVNKNPEEIRIEVRNTAANGDPAHEIAAKAIAECITASCNAPVSEALEIQAKHSAGFMAGKLCRNGQIGSEFKKINQV
jgi:hypothetical protein